MAYSISVRAAEDIYWIYQQSRQQFGERAASAYQDLLGNAVKFAADHPMAAPVREIAGGAARVRYFGSHLIVYDCVGDDIVVQRVFHQHQDWDVKI